MENHSLTYINRYLGKHFKFQSDLNIPQEAVAKRCSAKKVFLEISQNSQENTKKRL